MKLLLQFADKVGIAWAQEQVARFHYLKKPIDVRCSVQGYIILLDLRRVGCLLFGRPEAQRCNGWYGSVEDVLSGKCRITRWQILNLARVWLDPIIQRGGEHYIPNHCSASPLIISWQSRPFFLMSHTRLQNAYPTVIRGYIREHFTRPLTSN